MATTCAKGARSLLPSRRAKTPLGVASARGTAASACRALQSATTNPRAKTRPHAGLRRRATRATRAVTSPLAVQAAVVARVRMAPTSVHGIPHESCATRALHSRKPTAKPVGLAARKSATITPTADGILPTACAHRVCWSPTRMNARTCSIAGGTLVPVSARRAVRHTSRRGALQPLRRARTARGCAVERRLRRPRLRRVLRRVRARLIRRVLRRLIRQPRLRQLLRRVRARLFRQRLRASWSPTRIRAGLPTVLAADMGRPTASPRGATVAASGILMSAPIQSIATTFRTATCTPGFARRVSSARASLPANHSLRVVGSGPRSVVPAFRACHEASHSIPVQTLPSATTA